jgi:hypothetical protein
VKTDEQEEIDDSNNEGDSRQDTREPTHAQRKEIQTNEVETPKSPVRAERDNRQVRIESDDDILDEPQGLFREKDKMLDDTMIGGLFPPQQLVEYDLESPKLQGKAVVSHVMAVADGNLASMFRRCVAEAWEPSKIEAFLESERHIAAVKRDGSSNFELVASLQPTHRRDISSEDVAMAFGAFTGEAHDNVSMDQLSELIGHRRVMARHDGYHRRFHARANKNAPSNRKWSQRAQACKHSLRGLEALSEFAEYNRQQLTAANAPAVA